MSNNSKIVLITALIIIVAVHVAIAMLTPQQWMLVAALVYVIAALLWLWSMWE